MYTLTNHDIAQMFRECAELLHQQDANPFRVSAYKHAAQTLDSLDRDVQELLEREGLEGLTILPAIGRGLASAIDEIARSGRLSLLERLRGSSQPEALFQTIPSIGPELAHAIHDTLHIDSLEGLEVAAHDGRLQSVPGIGPRRIAAIQASLESMFGRSRRWSRADGPPVDIVLDVDREYREKALADSLPKLAPKRFNPEGEAWLPILHAERGGWHFTALFSNTARAHELGRTRDWVVIYFYDEHHREGQHTIVTESRGPMKGMRVIRGRERECAALYRQ